ncbi:hypothetical protein SteCoe_1346 [Stentor coeruleus]|uniref:Uncharacterized protein n=1 Tax=Stentor coeruleus TaxID=5963 RepID=A0A1R2D1Z6_9CILI|nr:hypothetical protein SteCoe_1346 [Stentor coeruleus]
MNRNCAQCNKEFETLGLICPNNDYFCQCCYNEIFRVNVLITCPACSRICKISDFSWQMIVNQDYNISNSDTKKRLSLFSEEPIAFSSQKYSELYEISIFSSQNVHSFSAQKENHLADMITFNETTGKEMPECMNLDSDYNIELMEETLKNLVIFASGYDSYEYSKSCRQELVDGLIENIDMDN